MKNQRNLDAVFVGTDAPGQSALNPVERRMAPLSHDISGLILPYDFRLLWQPSELQWENCGHISGNQEFSTGW